MTRIRFPHSAIPGSFLAVRSPRLIADFYGLHRYWLSRHPLSVPLITFLCIDLTSNRRSIDRYFRLKIFLIVTKLLIESFKSVRFRHLFLPSFNPGLRPPIGNLKRFPRFLFFLAEVAFLLPRLALNFPHYIKLFSTLQALFSTFFTFYLILHWKRGGVPHISNAGPAPTDNNYTPFIS